MKSVISGGVYVGNDTSHEIFADNIEAKISCSQTAVTVRYVNYEWALASWGSCSFCGSLESAASCASCFASPRALASISLMRFS